MAAVRAIAIAAAAFLACGLWRAGIVWLHGWNGPAWLQEFNWGAIPVCAVIAAVSAFAVAPRQRPGRLLLFILPAWGICVAAFTAGRAEVFAIFSVWFAPMGDGPLLRLALYGIATAASLTGLAHLLLAPMRWWTAAGLAGALFLVLPLSGATAALFPDGGHVDSVNAVKLGYPVFWTALLVPAVLWAGVKSAARGQTAARNL
jgi:hypothetical protein